MPLVRLEIDIHSFSLMILFTGMSLPKTKYAKVMREFYTFIQRTVEIIFKVILFLDVNSNKLDKYQFLFFIGYLGDDQELSYY